MQDNGNRPISGVLNETVKLSYFIESLIGEWVRELTVVPVVVRKFFFDSKNLIVADYEPSLSS